MASFAEALDAMEKGAVCTDSDGLKYKLGETGQLQMLSPEDGTWKDYYDATVDAMSAMDWSIGKAPREVYLMQLPTGRWHSSSRFQGQAILFREVIEE